MTDVSLVARRVPVAIALAALGWAGGCSAGHDVDSENPALLVEDGGVDQGDESGGSGGTRASAGASSESGTSGGGNGGDSGGGAGGTGGQNPPPATGCNQCSDAMTQNGTLPGCCTDQNVCGVDIASLTSGGGGGQQMFGGGGQQMFGGGGNNNAEMCVERDAPGVATDACPSLDLMGVFTVPGCCRRDGTCGLRITMTAPLGCTTTEVANMVLPFGGGSGGQTVRCTPD